MTNVLFIAVFAMTCALTFVRAKKIDISNLCFEDGVLIGLIFYIVCPGIFLLYFEEIHNYELNARPFRPYDDLTTSANILVGWLSVLIFHSLRPENRRSIADIEHGRKLRRGLIMFGALYTTFTLVTFIASGRAEGGHWQHRFGEGLSNSSALILVGNFANVFRTAIFGYLIFATSRSVLRRTQALTIGLMVAALDFMLTFNRITAVYLIIAFILLYRRYFWIICGGFFVAAPIIGYFSSVWSVFRAFALRDGYTLQSLTSALDIASRTIQSGEQPIDKLLNSLFEASNLLVLNHIVDRIDEGFPILWGQTFIGRSLTFLVPSTIWPEKPKVFGTILGDYIQSTAGLALNSTLFGEAIANFYYFWPIALVFTLLVVAALFRQLSKHLPAAGYLGCFIGIALWRFDMAFAFISLFALLIFCIGKAVIENGPQGLHQRSSLRHKQPRQNGSRATDLSLQERKEAQ